MKKILIIISYSVFALLLVLGIIYYKERVLYLDSAYAVFNLINNGAPAIEHARYAFYLLELFPWLGLKVGLPIPNILQLFSLSHILIAFIAFVILLKIKQPKLAFLLTIFQILSYRESFFLSLNETSLLISATILLGGFMVYYENKNTATIIKALVFLVLATIALFSHPMAVLILPFVINIHWASLNYKFSQNIKIVVIFFASILVLKKVLIPASDYEIKLYLKLSDTWQTLSNLKSVYSFNYFYGDLNLNSYFINIYFIPILIFIFILGVLFKQKKYFLLCTYLVYVIVLWILIIVIFNQGDGNMFMEKNFTPWVFVCIYPIILFNSQFNKTTLVLFSGMILYSFYGISKTSNIYINRFAHLDHLLTQNYQKNDKLIINDSLIDHAKFQGTWALPYETLLLSKIKKIPNTTIRIFSNEANIQKELYRKDIFLGADFIAVLPATYLLNQKYFKLEEKPYLEVTNQ